MQKMLTVKDIQDNLGIGKEKAYKIVNMKSFPKLKIGRGIYIPEDKYNQWINENTKSSISL